MRIAARTGGLDELNQIVMPVKAGIQGKCSVSGLWTPPPGSATRGFAGVTTVANPIRLWLLAACMMALLAGCGSDVKLEGATTSSVTVSFDPKNSDGLKEATQVADRHCREQNRSAVFQNVMPYGSRNLASFTCGPR